MKTKIKKDYKVTRIVEECFYTEASSKEEAEKIARESNDPYIATIKKVKVEVYKGD